MSRILSYTEISTALDCWARWSFRYGDGMGLGAALKQKAVVPRLSAGRAWGAAVAAWHHHVDEPDAGERAIAAMDEALEADAERMREYGVYDSDKHADLRVELLAMLNHYIDLAPKVKMEGLERELLVAIPSRSGKRPSSRYKLLAYLDATEQADDGVWINEFKLRQRLTPARLITNSRQIRWYAWAYQQETGQQVRGVWVNERLHAAPKPPRILASGKLSHAKEQLCTADAYVAACEEHGEEPRPSTLEALRQRQWQQRVPVIFREDELEEAGRELVSAAKLIGQLDSGRLEPVRHVSPRNCGGCPYAEICEAPQACGPLIDMFFERRPAKRDMPPPALEPTLPF